MHGVINSYEQLCGDQGPTIQYMKGSDAKDIVIERLIWGGTESRNSSKSTTPIKMVHINRPSDGDADEDDGEKMATGGQRVAEQSNGTESTVDEDDDLKLDLSDITFTPRGDGGGADGDVNEDEMAKELEEIEAVAADLKKRLKSKGAPKTKTKTTTKKKRESEGTKKSSKRKKRTKSKGRTKGSKSTSKTRSKTRSPSKGAERLKKKRRLNANAPS